MKTDEGLEVFASLPVIISASRSTDIPAYYAEWFIERLNKGYIRWINPFNNRSYYVSFANTRFVVFWSKNPDKIIPFLSILDRLGINYYFLFTLNDYEKEGFEPNIPSLQHRIESFINLSMVIGKDRVIWRFDPILRPDPLEISDIIERIKNIGNRLYPFTKKLVFSFIDMKYSKVKRQTSGYNIFPLTKEEKLKVISGLLELNKNWRLPLASCADEADYSPEIAHNSCIDGNLIRSICHDDPVIISYLKSCGKKDPGQRPACKCVKSKDIGQYDTCPAGCVYCYATDHEKAGKNYLSHQNNRSDDTITGKSEF